MNKIPALALTVAIYSGLIWAYIAFRIILGNFPMSAYFIDGIDISFWELALSCFVTSFFATFTYLITIPEEKPDEPHG
jgi:hypothetical protein